MMLYSIYDKEFKAYGKVIDHDFASLLDALEKTEAKDSVEYLPTFAKLEESLDFPYLQNDIYGGQAIQIGYCNGKNNILNALEYHKDNEVNIPLNDIILLLGLLTDVENNIYDTKNVKAFLVPKTVAVELYSTTLHYAPCGNNNDYFKVAVVLPKGTNEDKPVNSTDKLLFARNKWLLAHKDSPEAKNGAYIGLIGENIKL